MTKFRYKKLSLKQKQLGPAFFLETLNSERWKILATLLGMSAKLQKATISFFIPACLSFGMEQVGSHRID
jgi:hypothetical protein